MEHKNNVLIFPTAFLSNSSHSKSELRDVFIMCTGLHVKYPLVCQLSIILKCSRQVLERCSNNELHENPSSVGQVVPCRRTDGQSAASIRVFPVLRTRLKILRCAHTEQHLKHLTFFEDSRMPGF
jgi:hypothetical protein